MSDGFVGGLLAVGLVLLARFVWAALTSKQ